MSGAITGLGSPPTPMQIQQKLQSQKIVAAKSEAATQKRDADGDHDGDTSASDKGGLDVNG